MHKIGDYVVYKKDVCKINKLDKDYYILNPIDDETLTIKLPISSNLLRDLIDKKECDKLIKSIPKIDIINTPDKNLESEYKKLLNSGNLEDLVKIIKTTYLRNENRLNNHKKIGEKDDTYFKRAEKLLYNEMSVSLGLSYEETKKYVLSTVEDLVK